MTKEDYKMIKGEMKKDFSRTMVKGTLVFLGLWAALSAFLIWLIVL